MFYSLNLLLPWLSLGEHVWENDNEVKPLKGYNHFDNISILIEIHIFISFHFSKWYQYKNVSAEEIIQSHFQRTYQFSSFNYAAILINKASIKNISFFENENALETAIKFCVSYQS